MQHLILKRVCLYTFILMPSIDTICAADYGRAAAMQSEATLQELKTREQEARAQQKAWETAATRAEIEKIKAASKARVAEELVRNKRAMSIEDELKKLESLTEHDLNKTALLHQQAMEKMELLIASAKDFLGDKERLSYAVGAVTASAFGIYSAKRATTLVADMAKVWLTKPSLVDETSRFHWSGFRQLREQITRMRFRKSPATVILEEDLTKRMNRIIRSTINTKKNNGFYQHILLYGPPGTGKTLAMRKHAIDSRMDYAIMSGANFDRFNDQDAQKELANLFSWAQRSRKGLLLFIDEADAFLESRQSNNISERTRKLISSFLAQTGTETKHFQIALATNHPEILDPAVLDRVDHKLKFDLPDYESRCQLIQLYWDRYVKDDQADSYDLTSEDIWLIAQKTERFSGRAISKLVLSIRSAGWADDEPISRELVYEVLQQKLNEKREF